MSVNRLFEIIYILLDKKTLTARELAAHFEVSVRTIYRDIDVLSLAGVPVYTTKGTGGGISIHNDYVLNKSVLTDDEQTQILVALQSLNITPQLDSGKLFTRLSSLFQKTNSNWVEIDYSHWGSSREEQEKFDLVKASVMKQHMISFDYISSYGEPTSRSVCPVKLIFKARAWYLQGYCLNKKDYRTFKINRIKTVSILPEHFLPDTLPPPPQLEIREANRMDLVSLKIKFAPSISFRLYDEFTSDEITPLSDGYFLVTVKLPDDFWLYSFILSFGAQAEVIEPEYVRNRLAKEAEKLINNYNMT